MMKKLLACVAALLFAGALLAVPAIGQEAPASPATVLPDEVTQPTPAPAPAEVAGDTVTKPAPQVLGETTTRGSALPLTGGEFGAAAILGLGLTGAGVALAAGARRRRTRFEAIA